MYHTKISVINNDSTAMGLPLAGRLRSPSTRGVNENQAQNNRTQKFIFKVGQRFAEGSFQLFRTG